MKEFQRVIADGVLKELWFWKTNPLDPLELSARTKALSEKDDTKFQIEVIESEVSLVKKNAMNDKSWCERHGEQIRRANFYVDFIGDAMRLSNQKMNFKLLIDVDDTPGNSVDVPVFAFQKKLGSRNILLPDIDLLTYNFFEDALYKDNKQYIEKDLRAIFVGATTGGIISRDSIDTLSIPRLRSAVFFRDSERVSFTLPVIVQTESDDLVNEVQALGVVGERLSWNQQFTSRFLISIDGNGAACSRLAIGLRSNSIVLKYDSLYELCYSHALKPWRHFIPIAQDVDVENILKLEEIDDFSLQLIAESSARFAKKFLNRDFMLKYTNNLLINYSNAMYNVPTT